MNPKISKHPAYDANLVAKCKEKNMSDAETLGMLDAVQQDRDSAQAGNAVLAARAVGQRLGSRRSIQRAMSQ